MPLQKVRESAVPFEVVGLVGFLAGGIVVLAGGEFPVSIAATLPDWAQTAWAIALCLGSALGLIGLWWRRDPADGIWMEASGVYIAGTASVIYAIAIAFRQPVGTVAVLLGILGAFGIACLWRGILLVLILHRAARRSELAS
jgi:hypothetical protein